MDKTPKSNKTALPVCEAGSIAFLFEDWEETMLWSYFQGHMGHAYTDNLQVPRSAQIIVGSFCFLAGMPEETLVLNIPADIQSDILLMIPRQEAWCELIESVYQERAFKMKRYAIKKEPDVFDREQLRRYSKTLPKGYRLAAIDEAWYKETRNTEWSVDLTSQFSTYTDYEKHGIGVVAIYQGKLVAGASSYTVYNGGIEIEIDTAPEHREKGLATACGAKLILECLERGIYPSWDAHDLRSVALAEKLGYHMDYSYTTYCIQTKKARYR